MSEQKDSVLLSTAYLPPVSYFFYLLKNKEIVIEQWETYPKQTFRNRCVIFSERGKLPLTIPVSKTKGNQTKTGEIGIFKHERWQLNHWRAICSAYTSSPFFLYYRDELEYFYTGTFENLLDFNLETTRVLMDIIGISTKITLSEKFVKSPREGQDMRFAISPKMPEVLLEYPKYTQVFSNKHGFIPNLSIIDLLFNVGPETENYLENLIEVNS